MPERRGLTRLDSIRPLGARRRPAPRKELLKIDPRSARFRARREDDASEAQFFYVLYHNETAENRYGEEEKKSLFFLSLVHFFFEGAVRSQRCDRV